MGKRYGWLYEKAFSKENISLAIEKASKGKRKRKIVKRILGNKEFYVDEIYNMIWNNEFVPTPYLKCKIKDGISGKERELSKPRFYPDHIIHWCMYLVLYPILTKSMIHNTCASLKGRGQVYGKNICVKKLRKRKNTKYYLKLDIKKFYPSVNVQKLLILLERKIKDPKMMNLLRMILEVEQGLPIGMILSQLLSNYCLYQLDHEYDSHTYIRYADDIAIFGPNKRKLHQLRINIEQDLLDMDLVMKNNWQIYRTDKEMLDFMGYRMDHNKVIMRKAIMLRFDRKIRKYVKEKNYRNACAIVSYMGWVKNSDSWNFYNNRVRNRVDFIEVKKLIKNGGNNDENLQK